MIPYAVNAPMWSDGAQTRRWIALPGLSRIRFDATGAWSFPTGTVFVKHFDLPQIDLPARRVETRLLYVDRDGEGYGATYRWNTEQNDAELLSEGSSEIIEVQTKSTKLRVLWSYPSRKDCLRCHTRNAGFVLGANTRQLNCKFFYTETQTLDEQLRAWSHVGLFENPPAEHKLHELPKLADIKNNSMSLETRVRSYLDANCAHCHQPGGARGVFDARYHVPLNRQGLVEGKLITADFGLRDARVVAPGSIEKSIFYLRMDRRHDPFAMPPLATNEVDRDALEVIANWIEGLTKP
jgi:uncharacterized repeat protein (TIGR03806 family)